MQMLSGQALVNTQVRLVLIGLSFLILRDMEMRLLMVKELTSPSRTKKANPVYSQHPPTQ